jgi:hypothetical protein
MNDILVYHEISVRAFISKACKSLVSDVDEQFMFVKILIDLNFVNCIFVFVDNKSDIVVAMHYYIYIYYMHMTAGWSSGMRSRLQN